MCGQLPSRCPCGDDAEAQWRLHRYLFSHALYCTWPTRSYFHISTRVSFCFVENNLMQEIPCLLSKLPRFRIIKLRWSMLACLYASKPYLAMIRCHLLRVFQHFWWCLFFSVLIWLGDLNYRIEGMVSEMVKDCVENKQFKPLTEYDQVCLSQSILKVC